MEPAPVKLRAGAPLLARLAALQLLLAGDDDHAKRLARFREHQPRVGEAGPLAPPMSRTHRLLPELGAVATALPELLKTAFDSWGSSGSIPPLQSDWFARHRGVLPGARAALRSYL